MTKQKIPRFGYLPVSTVKKLVFHDRKSGVGNKLTYTFNKMQ